jgi:hypothetical protein
LFDSRPAIIGAREWGTNAEARLQHCDRSRLAKRRRRISCGAFLSLTRKKVESAPTPAPKVKKTEKEPKESVAEAA